MRTRSVQGFTVLELLIVIAIIGLLAAVLVPNLLNARRAANNTAARSLLIRAVQQAEAGRSAGLFPAATTLADNAHDCTYAGIDLSDWGTGKAVTKCRVTQDANGSYSYTRSSAGNWYYYDGSALNSLGTTWTVPW